MNRKMLCAPSLPVLVGAAFILGSPGNGLLLRTHRQDPALLPWKILLAIATPEHSKALMGYP